MEDECVGVGSQIKKKKKSRGRECAAYGCSNTFYCADGERTENHFFKFPLKNPEKLQWCNLIKRQDGKDNFKVTNETYLCQAHFKDSDIRKNLNTWRLNKGALPTLNVHQRFSIRLALDQI